MAKNRAPSKHSRAARRATSPGIDTDKSLKDVKPPPRDAAPRPSVLAVQRSAGVSKKAKNGRKSQLSAKARKRQERGLQMAEAIVERTSKKVEKSKGRGKNIVERSQAWEKINKEAEAAEQEADDASDDEDEEIQGDGVATKVDDDDADMGAAEAVQTGDAPSKKGDDGYLAIDEDEEIL
ncbi:Alb1-domain-containing protein [Emericellopsis atlantica]|uniref:Alb1-domain-containing protein n=1 Tax=Emericellopsis atlantica TaxID=2614577 RepID=A0A9P8CM13_9HYPO|nr:Alb1-domain-containing protein [Emericellopsis atlantica]KAG9252209.1 Alb1-domain-containing protein [Emericellopsis atlantica]